MRNMADLLKYKGLGIISLCVLSVLVSGCGKKLFPKAPGAAPAPQVKDLSAQVVPRSVELSWSPVAAGGTSANGYSILKAEVKWENRDCLECPSPDMRPVQRMDVAAKPGPDGKLRWADTDISYHRAFRYQITVVDVRGNSLSLSNPATAIIYPGPAAPVNVVAATQPQGILIQWKPVLKDLEGKDLQGANVSFRVERMSGEKGWEKASPSPVKGNSYYDQAISPDQSYSYRVVPVLYIDGEAVFGEPSATVLVKGPESIPPAPPDKVWVVPAHGAIEIHWTESEGKNSGYQVYRREGKEIIRLTATPVKHPPFVDHGAKKGLTYFYAVSAVSSQTDHKEGLLSKWIEVRNLFPE
jgi:hypothetical protein